MAPNHTSGDPPLPTLDQPTDTVQVPEPSSDLMSQLTEPSVLPASPIRASLGPADHGVPATPEQRAVGALDHDLYDTGYDSDGRRAPWEGVVEEDCPEEEILEEGEGPQNAIAVATVPVTPSPNPTVLTEADVMKMKVSDLKTHLKNRALSVKGKKSDLQRDNTV